MSTLASIIRAQLATGRPLRVTRALLVALEEPPARRSLNDVLPEALRDRVLELERERDEARAEVERLRAALAVERSLECDASAVIREAEERGARWAYSDFVGGSERASVEVMAYRQREAERICAEARKATE